MPRPNSSRHLGIRIYRKQGDISILLNKKTMKEISIADFQVLEPGAMKLNQSAAEKTVGFTIPEDMALDQVVVLQTKITVKEDGSIFKVSVGETPIWGMRADAGHTRGLWQTFIAKQAFGDQKGKTVGITFSVPDGHIIFSDIVIWYQRDISI